MARPKASIGPESRAHNMLMSTMMDKKKCLYSTRLVPTAPY